MARLSTLDGAFLRLETPDAHMHVGWLARTDVPAGADALTAAAVRAQVAARLHLAPRFRQKLVPAPLGLAEPAWEDDPSFALQRHVRTAWTAGPATEEELQVLVDEFLSVQLDRRRPLWELLVIPQLAAGGAAVVGKVHHAMVDGIAAVELGVLLFDGAPAAEPAALPVPWQPAGPNGRIARARGAIGDGAALQLRAARGAMRLGMSPGRGARLADAARRAALSLADDLRDPAPSSFLTGPIGPRRTLVTARLDLGRMLALRTAAKCTLNDVVLASVAGGLRGFHFIQNEGPPLRHRAMVPVSTREGESGGNRIAFAFVDLPCDERRPKARLQAVSSAVRAARTSGEIDGARLIQDALVVAPGVLKTAAARMMASPRVYSLAVSNVPGPRTELFIAGAPVREIYPVIPLSDGHRLAIGLLTYNGAAQLAIYADPEALPGVRGLVPCIEMALEELEHAYGTRPAARAAPRVSAGLQPLPAASIALRPSSQDA